MSKVVPISPADQAALEQAGTVLGEATFKRWLLSLPLSQVVGTPRNSTGCPLCFFLLAQTGRYWLIDNRRAYLVDTLAQVPALVLPSWAAQYAGLVDMLCLERVTVRAALDLLEGKVPRD